MVREQSRELHVVDTRRLTFQPGSHEGRASAAVQGVGQLQLVGVPALPIPPSVREAIETAWFENRALRIVYEKKAWQLSPRLVKIRNLVFDRQVTLLNVVDLETNQDRQFRVDKIKQATLMDQA